MSASEAAQQANRAELEPSRIVVIFYLVAAVIISAFVAQAFNAVAAWLQLSETDVIAGVPYTDPPRLIGYVVALGGIAYCWFNPRVRGLSMEVATELMRVTWPSMEETRMHTFAVVVASLIASIILFGMDTLAFQAMVNWLPALWEKL